MNAEDRFQQIINDEKRDLFTADALTERFIDEQALGVLIARWAEWDIRRIVEVAATALEDANAHPECAALIQAAQEGGVFDE